MVRRGARQGRSKRKENEKKVQQQPFFFTQNPFVPLEPLSSDQLESIHRASMIILEPVSYTHLTLPTTERV